MSRQNASFGVPRRGRAMAMLAIVSVVAAAAAGQDPAVLDVTANAGYTQLLKNGTTWFQATVTNAAVSGGDSMDWAVGNGATPGLTLSGSGSAMAPQMVAQVSGTYTSSVYGTHYVSASATGTNSAMGGPATGTPGLAGVSIAVGEAAAADSGYNNLNAFAADGAFKSDVAAGGSYAGLASRTTTGGAVVGTEAKILWGYNTSGAATTVSMNWRTRATVETFPTMTDPPTNFFEYGLAGDVSEMQGMNGTKFVLQMSYLPDSLLVVDVGRSEEWYAREGWFYMGWLDKSGSDMSQWHWRNAVEGNLAPGNDPSFQGLGAWNGDTVLGHWGVDIDNNVVWAVLDHNSQFTSIPEPVTASLLVLGGVAVFLRPRKRL